MLPERHGHNKSSIGMTIDTALIIQLCSALVIWLNLKAGISRETANTFLKALQFTPGAKDDTCES
jgi:hypothetical protein